MHPVERRATRELPSPPFTATWPLSEERVGPHAPRQMQCLLLSFQNSVSSLFPLTILPPPLPSPLRWPVNLAEAKCFATNLPLTEPLFSSFLIRRRCWADRRRRSLFCLRTPLAGGTRWTSLSFGRIEYSTSSPLSTDSSPLLLL